MGWGGNERKEEGDWVNGGERGRIGSRRRCGDEKGVREDERMKKRR